MYTMLVKYWEYVRKKKERKVFPSDFKANWNDTASLLWYVKNV
jgi:hypothetical protein